jgi:hypothetical protein
LYHVVALRLSVDKKVKTDLLLELNNTVDLLLDEFFVLLLGKLAFAELRTSLTDFFGLLYGM